MTEVLGLYQQVILDHYRNPRNFGKLAAGARQADGDNPLCGDRITVYIQVAGEVVVAAAFEGTGCAICIASASLMTEEVRGKTIAEADSLGERVRDLVTAAPDAPLNTTGPISALAGVRRVPLRAKCALLPWYTLRAVLHQDGRVVSTE